MLKCVLTLSAEFVEAAKYGVMKLLSVTTRLTHNWGCITQDKYGRLI
jgi:hypothetical protein